MTLQRGDGMDRSEKKKTKHVEIEQPIPSRIYPVIDTDLARDNLENDIPAADLEDLRETSRSGSRRIDG